jgi:LPS-assembly protein
MKRQQGKDISGLLQIVPTQIVTICILVQCLFLIVLTSHLEAQEQEIENVMGSFKGDDPAIPWIIEADNLKYDIRRNRYDAQGHVVIQKGNRIISANRIHFDKQNMTALAEGNVRATSGGDFLTGQRVELDLSNKTGTIYDGYLYLRENNFHIKGQSISKTGEDTYEIENASVTTCDGDIPDWRIEGKKVRVTVEGFGEVRGATLRARKWPVLYSPLLYFPAKTKRQTGLLFPELGRSKRWGYFINQPFFWAINDSADATFYGHYMTERGLKLGGETRYFLSETTKGAWMFDYLYDRQIDDGTGDSSERWGYVGDGVLRPNRDRYWFRGGHYSSSPLGIRTRLELDIVSDQDYLNEFKTGYSGYDTTRAYFLGAFNRQLNDYTDPARLNRFEVARTWDKFNLNIDFRWTDDVVKRRFEDTDDTLQRLPLILFAGIKQRIFSTGLFFDLDSSYNFFYREDGDRGQRLDVYPRLYRPFRFGQYFTFEPSIGLRETLWWITPEDSMTGVNDNDNFQNRFLWDGRAELTSEIFKVFVVEGKKIDRIKHTLQPRIIYQYLPDVGQEDLPGFDAIDSISPENVVTYSITNFLISRIPQLSEKTGQDNETQRYKTNQFCRFKLEQSYDINQARGIGLLEGDEKRPFSPIGAELDIFWIPQVVMNSDAKWDVYDNRLDEGNVELRLSDLRGDTLTAEYRYTRFETQSIFADLLLRLTDAISTGFVYERNIETGQRLKAGARLLYRAGCWGINLNYLDEPSNRRFEFAIDLFGLGEISAAY